jgi:hypothetical protein
MGEDVRCRYKTKQGTQCSRMAIKGFSGCFHHEPSYELVRRNNAQKGGRLGGRGRSSKPVSTTPGADDLVRLQGQFERLADDVLTGKVDKSRAAVACQALVGARACAMGHAKLKEQYEFEQRLSVLEQGWGAYPADTCRHPGYP